MRFHCFKSTLRTPNCILLYAKCTNLTPTHFRAVHGLYTTCSVRCVYSKTTLFGFAMYVHFWSPFFVNLFLEPRCVRSL